MIKVAITDDHEMVLTGLKQMLTEAVNIELAGAYLSGKALLEGIKKQIPDVLLLDLQLPDHSGEELAKTILAEYPNICILVLTSVDDVKNVKQMIQLGCKGYSLKNISQPSLLDAIQLVYKKELYLDPVLKEAFLQDALMQQQLKSSVSTISRREKEILQMLAVGESSKSIAEQLCISVYTVENHRKSLLRKLAAKNTPGLLNAAKQQGILDE